ncbi:MAG: S-layer protein [Candidatus Frackibacter sp. T328-2]|nr:MAG: S-layer protein [Candidatus Frackibacter sp. T328-2]
MKRLISTLIVISMILTFTLPALAAEKIKDVPKSHWAYQDVKKLVDNGLMSLYEDNTFKGEKKVNRYQLAEVVAKILVAIDQEKVNASKSDIKTLRKLSTEFRTELVELNQQTDIFNKRIKKLEEKNKIIKEDLVSTKGELMEIRKEVNKIIEDIRVEIENNLNARLNRIERQNQNLSNRVTALEEKLADTKAENSGLQNKVKNWKFALIGVAALLISSQ